MHLILEMDCGLQIEIFGTGDVFLPDLSGDSIDISTLEETVAQIRAVDRFLKDEYILKTEHNQVVEQLKTKLTKKKGKK